jgi:L-lysine 2,3-aminomutase
MTEWTLVTQCRYCIFRDGVKFCEADTKEDADEILEYVKRDNGVK